jgi:methanogenic corrinoid protein MtbC1
MISDYFDMLGFKPYYLGTNVPTSALIEMIADVKPEILAVSATMSYHVDSLTNLIQVIKKEPALKQVVDHGLKFVVGGQGFDNGEQAIAIGADLFASDYASLRNGLAALGKIDLDEAI